VRASLDSTGDTRNSGGGRVAHDSPGARVRRSLPNGTKRAAPELTRFSPRRGVTTLVLGGPNRGAPQLPPADRTSTRETDDRLAGGPAAVAPGNYFR